MLDDSIPAWFVNASRDFLWLYDSINAFYTGFVGAIKEIKNFCL